MFKKLFIIISTLALLTGCSKPQSLPALELKNLAGETISLSSYKGKTLLIDFWATWCPPCRDSFPWMNEMQNKYKDQGLEIVAISLDHDKKAVERFTTKIPPAFTVLLDPTSLSARSYKVIGMPMSFLYDKNGILVEKHVGFSLQKTDLYEASIKKALAR